MIVPFGLNPCGTVKCPGHGTDADKPWCKESGKASQELGTVGDDDTDDDDDDASIDSITREAKAAVSKEGKVLPAKGWMKTAVKHNRADFAKKKKKSKHRRLQKRQQRKQRQRQMQRQRRQRQRQRQR